MTGSTFITPQSLMSTKLINRIINLAHDQKIRDLTNLCDQVSWGFVDTYSTKIITLVQQFCPPPSNSPFTTAPLQSASTNTNIPTPPGPTTDHPKKKWKCKRCGMEGHYGV